MKEIRKYFMNNKNTNTRSWVCSKSSAQRENYSYNHLHKERSIQINNLTLYPKELDKEEWTKLKLAENKEQKASIQPWNPSGHVARAAQDKLTHQAYWEGGPSAHHHGSLGLGPLRCKGESKLH